MITAIDILAWAIAAFICALTVCTIAYAGMQLYDAIKERIERRKK